MTFYLSRLAKQIKKAFHKTNNINNILLFKYLMNPLKYIHTYVRKNILFLLVNRKEKYTKKYKFKKKNIIKTIV